MTNDLQSRIQSLENQLRVLVEENAQLTERAEDSLLTGLISETIQEQQNGIDMVTRCLEHIAILKNIPFCSCGRLTGTKLEEMTTYTSFSNLPSIGYPIEINREIEENLEHGPVLVTDLRSLSCTFNDSQFQPAAAVLIPFKTMDIPKGVFLFMDSSVDNAHFTAVSTLLNHIANMMTVKYDNLFLLDALQTTNKKLEQRVKDRTVELTQANQALQESEQQKRDLLNNTSSVIYIKDLNGHYLFTNRMYEKRFGYSHGEIQGKTDHDFFPKGIADIFRSNDLKALEANAVLEFEETVPFDGGELTYISIKFPLKNTSGETYAICGISTDITERKQAEQALRRSQKMDAIGQMAGGIAHDFNNILSIIIGNTSFLEHDISANAKAMKRIGSIKKASQRAADLTRQLLSFSRKELTQLSVIEVNQVIRDMEGLIRRSITPEVTVELKLAAALWPILIDTGGLEDTLLNLAFNARDAMPSGGNLIIESSNCTLDAAYCRENPGLTPGHYVQVAVSDNGEGIPAEQQEHIFEPFFTTKPQGKGTGLGLAMVFGFIKRANGCIKVYSEPGIGTTFRLFFPRAKEDKLRTDVTNDAYNPLPVGNETILAVDDEQDLLELAKELLENLGYQVLTASNGEQALECLAKEPGIDLLFSDIVMPGGLNGYELAQHATAILPNLKVLLTSGYTEKALTHNRHTRFNAPILSKPYALSDLARQLRQLLEEPKNH